MEVKMKKTLIVALFILAGVSLLAYNTSNYKEIGGGVWGIRGELDVKSGGEIDVESGGSLKLAGTALTSTATELNILDGVTSTTAELNILDVSLQTTTATTAGAISVTKRIANIDSTGGTFAVTLAAPDASMVGSLLTIEQTVDGGNVTMALTNVVGQSSGTTATFNDAGDALVLIAGSSSKWIVIKEYGIALS